jgi:hypothetical protein
LMIRAIECDKVKMTLGILKDKAIFIYYKVDSKCVYRKLAKKAHILL